MIHKSEAWYNPNTIKDHADFVLNSYFLKKFVCVFHVIGLTKDMRKV